MFGKWSLIVTINIWLTSMFSPANKNFLKVLFILNESFERLLQKIVFIFKGIVIAKLLQNPVTSRFLAEFDFLLPRNSTI